MEIPGQFSTEIDILDEDRSYPPPTTWHAAPRIRAPTIAQANQVAAECRQLDWREYCPARRCNESRRQEAAASTLRRRRWGSHGAYPRVLLSESDRCRSHRARTRRRRQTNSQGCQIVQRDQTRRATRTAKVASLLRWPAHLRQWPPSARPGHVRATSISLGLARPFLTVDFANAVDCGLARPTIQGFPKALRVRLLANTQSLKHPSVSRAQRPRRHRLLGRHKVPAGQQAYGGLAPLIAIAPADHRPCIRQTRCGNARLQLG
jgi:hypothetical protein